METYFFLESVFCFFFCECECVWDFFLSVEGMVREECSLCR